MKKIVFVLLAYSITLSAQESVIDSLEIQNLEEVIVSSVRVKENIPIAFNNVSKDEISKRNLGQDIPILLNFLPNVVTTSDAGAGIGYTGIRIRGINSQSTNVTINGIPYNDAESLGTFWVDLPDFSSSVENLQMQRGIGTSVNGSSAFGASINILTDKISEEPYFESANSVGSFNTLKNNFSFSTGLLNNTFEFSGRISKIDSDGYIDRASSDLKSHFFQLSYKKNKSLFKFINFGGHEITYQAWNGIDLQTLENDRTYNPSGLYYDLNGQEQFHENEVDNYKQDHFQFHWTQSISSNLISNLGLNLTNGKGYYEQYNENGSEDFITRKWLDNQFYVINYNVNYSKNKNNLIFGSTYSEYDGDHYGETIWSQNSGNIAFTDLFYNGNGLKKDFSNFIKSIYQFTERIGIYADLQLRKIDYTTSGSTSNVEDLTVNKHYSFFNPKAGLNFTLNDKNKIYFSLSRAFREPTRSDFENNINIQPEELVDYELGWKFNTKKFYFSSNLYYMNYKNQLVLTGALDDVGSPIRENSGKSFRKGIELESIFKATNNLDISSNISFSRNKNVDYKTNFDGVVTNWGNTDISFSPDLVSSIGVNFRPKEDINISILNKFVGEQFMSNTESVVSKLNSYSTTDLNFIYSFKRSKHFKEIIFTAMINNIFNKEYVSNGYYYTYDDTWSEPNMITTIEGTGYYPQALRNFLLGITFKL
jgi:iron complex outermembrane receptor protein